MINPLTKFHLSHIRTQPEALKVWRDHWDELHGYSFVLSEPTGGNAMGVAARTDFPEGGHLRSAFAHDNLWFLSHDTICRTLAEGVVQSKRMNAGRCARSTPHLICPTPYSSWKVNLFVSSTR